MMEEIKFIALTLYILPIVIYFSFKTTGFMTVSSSKISWDMLIFIPVLNFFGLLIILGSLFDWWE